MNFDCDPSASVVVLLQHGQTVTPSHVFTESMCHFIATAGNGADLNSPLETELALGTVSGMSVSYKVKILAIFQQTQRSCDNIGPVGISISVICW